jgi:prophage regulatory protein
MAATKTPATKSLFLRKPAVLAAVGFSHATLHRLVARGEFPAPRKIGERAVGWLTADVERWAASRPVSDNLPGPAAGLRR